MVVTDIGARVIDKEGDCGIVIKARPPEPQNTIFGFLPGKAITSVLVRWETLKGGSQPVSDQESWEDPADLTLT